MPVKCFPQRLWHQYSSYSDHVKFYIWPFLSTSVSIFLGRYHPISMQCNQPFSHPVSWLICRYDYLHLYQEEVHYQMVVLIWSSTIFWETPWLVSNPKFLQCRPFGGLLLGYRIKAFKLLKVCGMINRVARMQMGQCAIPYWGHRQNHHHSLLPPLFVW